MKIPSHEVPTQFNLTGKVIVITGAGYGLGREMAIGLAAAGATLVLASRSEVHLRETADLISQKGGIASIYCFDATSKKSVSGLMEYAVSSYGRIDVMVINHGVITVATPEDTEEDEWNRVVNTNLTSCFYCAQAAGRQMIDQGDGGSIIITSSNGSLVSFDGLAAYGASKGGVDQLCRQLASEWGKYKIRVNTVNPGYTKNPMSGKPMEPIDDNLEKEIAALTPLGRRGEINEFVGPIMFLASDASSYVSGHSLTVDGGYCAR